MESAQSISLKKLRLIIAVIITVFIFALLLWAYYHGGVPSHHIFDRKDMPAISNWWSGILLPVLSWILLGRIKSRIEKTPANEHRLAERNILLLFIIGLSFGIILSLSFINNFKPFLDNALYIILFLSLIVPIFFSEFMLGFVLGMTYTFGAILPTAFILIMAAIGFLLYRFLRPLILKLTKIFRNKSKSE